MQTDEDLPENTLPLVGIKVQKGQFLVHQQGVYNGDEYMWLVIRSLKKRGYRLAGDDILRLGRIKLKAKFVESPDENPRLLDSAIAQELLTEVEACRICLHDHNSLEDPLLSPCKCIGSMGFVHASCLKEWLKSKVSTRFSMKATSYYWKDISCELCNCLLYTSPSPRDS